MRKSKFSRGNILAIIISSILVLDQFSKIWIKTHFTLHQSVNILGKWFQLYFVENEGMAFGMVFGGDNGKLILSLFRVALSIFIMWYICRLLKKPDTPMGVLVGLSMVFVGAIGNIIDCAFYGLIFSESGVTEVATMFPPGGGYGTFLHGEAISIGQVAASHLSAALTGLDPRSVDRIRDLFLCAGLPVTAKFTPKQRGKLFDAMRLDKKVSGGEIKFVLARAIGSVAWGQRVPEAEVQRALDQVAP